MIVLPPGLVSTKYPGYFFDIKNKKLYSIKSGILKEIKRKRRYVAPGGHIHEEHYSVSHEGIRRQLTLRYLEKLTFPVSVETYPIQL